MLINFVLIVSETSDLLVAERADLARKEAAAPKVVERTTETSRKAKLDVVNVGKFIGKYDFSTRSRLLNVIDCQPKTTSEASEEGIKKASVQHLEILRERIANLNNRDDSRGPPSTGTPTEKRCCSRLHDRRAPDSGPLGGSMSGTPENRSSVRIRRRSAGLSSSSRERSV